MGNKNKKYRVICNNSLHGQVEMIVDYKTSGWEFKPQ